ncbi:MAG TPA: hypothetical protein VKJ67_01900 [Methylomirabilota bacterium]|nr:hypothetical protein [Methylomirabilota bacterium]
MTGVGSRYSVLTNREGGRTDKPEAEDDRQQQVRQQECHVRLPSVAEYFQVMTAKKRQKKRLPADHYPW